MGQGVQGGGGPTRGEGASSGKERRGEGAFRSHLLPRTRAGWIAVLLFLGLFVLVEPPFVHGLANRLEPWILGVPFLYAYLLVLYTALIGVLIWALRRNL